MDSRMDTGLYVLAQHENTTIDRKLMPLTDILRDSKYIEEAELSLATYQ